MSGVMRAKYSASSGSGSKNRLELNDFSRKQFCSDTSSYLDKILDKNGFSYKANGEVTFSSKEYHSSDKKDTKSKYKDHLFQDTEVIKLIKNNLIYYKLKTIFCTLVGVALTVIGLLIACGIIAVKLDQSFFATIIFGLGGILFAYAPHMDLKDIKLALKERSEKNIQIINTLESYFKWGFFPVAALACIALIAGLTILTIRIQKEGDV